LHKNYHQNKKQNGRKDLEKGANLVFCLEAGTAYATNKLYVSFKDATQVLFGAVRK